MGYVIIECGELPLTPRVVPEQMPSNQAVPSPEKAKEFLNLILGILNAGGDAILEEKGMTMRAFLGSTGMH
jgi:hypothetical protein